MKRYITFVLVAMSLVGLVACSNDNGIAAPDGEGQIALRFESSSMTRVDGIDDLNENLIKTIDCYFYPAGATDGTEAVWYQKFTFDGAGVQSTAEVTNILMPSDKMNDIFGEGSTDTGKIYAIANYGGEALPTPTSTSGEGTSVAALKATVVNAEWLTNENKGEFLKQSSFVMDSEMTEITKSEGNIISGTVPLFRTAAKVELTITGVAEKVQDADGNYWIPNISVNNNIVTGANVTMYNARTAASVDGTPQSYSEATSTTLQNYGFSNDNKYKQTNPFYTYPHAWSSSDQEAYLLLVVSWKKESDNTTANCYYEIPIGVADNHEILRNHIYQIGIKVGTLGSFVKEDPVQLTPSYRVVDWGTGDISAMIKDQRYLVVDQTSVVMNNVQEISIKYDSSHEVDVVAIETDNVAIETDNKVPVFDDYSVSVDNGYITFTHNLDNDHDDSDKEYDYLPLTFTITVSHKDDPTFKETITVVQYPAMYVTWDTMDSSTVFVNGNNSQSSGWWWVKGDLGGNSPNMYSINIGAFDSTTADYIIADPREPANSNNFEFHENINANSNVRATATDASGDNTLTGYRAAISGTESEHLVAPQLLWSSGYISNNGNGVSGTGAYNYQTNGKYRCAGYQENGYPAGRWRLPTPAEILYMARLCAEDKVARLFQDNQVYLSSNGGYKVGYANRSVTRDGDTSTSVRCVYDIWYWKDKCADVDYFIWGAEGDLAEKDKSQYLVPVE